MSRFYCPFCSSQNQFHKISSNGVLICGNCNDPLIRKPFINFRQIIGLVAASAFLAPLFIMSSILIKDYKKERLINHSEFSYVYLSAKENGK